MTTHTVTPSGMVIIPLHKNLLCEGETAGIRQTITDLVEKDVRHVVLDMRDVEHINSCGLGMLVALQVTLRRVDGDLYLVGLRDIVLEIIHKTRLDTVFHICNSMEEVGVAHT